MKCSKWTQIKCIQIKLYLSVSHVSATWIQCLICNKWAKMVAHYFFDWFAKMPWTNKWYRLIFHRRVSVVWALISKQHIFNLFNWSCLYFCTNCTHTHTHTWLKDKMSFMAFSIICILLALSVFLYVQFSLIARKQPQQVYKCTWIFTSAICVDADSLSLGHGHGTRLLLCHNWLCWHILGDFYINKITL